jgi:hypothetical protein
VPPRQSPACPGPASGWSSGTLLRTACPQDLPWTTRWGHGRSPETAPGTGQPATDRPPLAAPRTIPGLSPGAVRGTGRPCDRPWPEPSQGPSPACPLDHPMYRMVTKPGVSQARDKLNYEPQAHPWPIPPPPLMLLVLPPSMALLPRLLVVTWCVNPYYCVALSLA